MRKGRARKTQIASNDWQDNHAGVGVKYANEGSLNFGNISVPK